MKINKLLCLLLISLFFISSCGKKKEEERTNDKKDDGNNQTQVSKYESATITYFLCGGTNATTNKVIITKDDLPYVFDSPKKGKVSFLGWYDNEKYNGDELTLIENLDYDHYDIYAKWNDTDVYHKINYVLDGGILDSKASNQYLEGFKVSLKGATKDGYNFLGWKTSLENEEYVTNIDKSYNTDVTLYACFEEITEFSILYKYDDGELIKQDITTLDDFRNYLYEEIYRFSESKKDFETFISDETFAWSNGTFCEAELFLENGNGQINNNYFVLADGFEDWNTWMNTFSTQVASFSSKSAWADPETAYKALWDLVKEKGNNWTTDKINKVISAIDRTLWLVDSYSSKEETTLIGLTINDGRVFDGWYTANGMKMDTIPVGTKGELVLIAKFVSPIPVTSFVVNNQISELKKASNHVLTWSFNPSNASYKKLIFVSSNENILTISSNGIIKGINEGTATVTIRVMDNEELNVSFDVNVYIVPFIDVSFSNGNVIEIDNTTNLEAVAYALNAKDVIYTSLNPDIASVNENGEVLGIKEGYANIKITSALNDQVNLTVGVTVIPYSESEFFSIIAAAHNSEIHIQRKVNVAYQYLKDVYCSASDLLFNYNYQINREFEAVQSSVSSNHGGKKSSTEFICVHYTAGYQSTSTARANGQYFGSGGGGTSVHYTTGNDGIFHMLDDSLVGYHAGDGTGTKFEWIQTNVKATANVKPNWGVIEDSKSSTGYSFTINGQNTHIDVPIWGTRSNGMKVKLTNPLDAFTYFGPAWKVVDGYYYMGTTWACFTQVWDGAICSHGGNNNSIGIETACNEGSDLWLTYQITAQLVAHLMDENKLDITRVVGHNFFSGKDCPQTLLYNNANLWPHFMECVQAEYDLYEKMTKDNGYTITCVSNNPDILSDNGRIIKIPMETTTVSYTVTVTNNNTKETRVATFSSVVHGFYTE